MFLTRWLRNATTAPQARPAARRPRFRPAVEGLEAREVPAVLTVTTTADTIDPNDGVLSLREAVIRANASNETDTIAVPAGTYALTLAGPNEDAALTGDLDLTGHVKIQGAGAGATVIDGVGLDRVFQVLAGADVSLAGLTVRGGVATPQTGAEVGGGIWNLGTLTLDGCTVSGNRATADGYGGVGGGIGNGSSGKLTIRGSTIADNYSDMWGGGVANLGQLSATGTTFAGNTGAEAGGGIYTRGMGSSASADLDRCTFTGNTALGGGGIYAVESSLSVSWSTFSGDSGGDIVAYGVTKLQNNTFA